ncbi:Protein of unknown function [Bacillus cereus]|nr:Protein of unknown function [Bacillus cereus]SCN36699.1 Protein of unknown function [Bacillus wiedmannii]
MQYTQVADKS